MLRADWTKDLMSCQKRFWHGRFREIDAPPDASSSVLGEAPLALLTQLVLTSYPPVTITTNMNARIPTSSLLRRFCLVSSCSRTSAVRNVHAHAPWVPAPPVQTSRSFSSSRPHFAALASHPPGQSTELVYAPTQEALESLESEDADGPDIDLIPQEEARLDLTDRAAEVSRFRYENAVYVYYAHTICAVAIESNSSAPEQFNCRPTNSC